MAYANSPDRAPTSITSAKLVVAGGFGVGKTTFVGSVSEIPPVNTEAWMTQAGENIDLLKQGDEKTTTTVAMDFRPHQPGRGSRALPLRHPGPAALLACSGPACSSSGIWD